MKLIEISALALVIMWLSGFALHIAGGLIHILLILAAIIFLLPVSNILEKR